MIQFPMKFSVRSTSAAGIQVPWITKSDGSDVEISMAIPPEFEGPGMGFSPEDLYAMALQNCFVATFKVYAEKSKLQYETISVESILEVDRDENRRPWMARVYVRVTLEGATQKDTAQRLLEKTSQTCMILNSVKTEKTFQFDIL